MAESYDSFAQRAMPWYDDMLDAVVRYWPPALERVLELGCGTGALTARLAERYSAARITAVDAAAEMIDIAKERLAALDTLASVEFYALRFEQLYLEPASYDLITSNMSLHHVEDKAPFYASLHKALRTGGLLVFGDELQGALPYVEELHMDAWLELARLPGHLTEAEIASTIEHMEALDHYETLPRQLELLRGAGFAPVDCTWRHLNYGVFVAQA